MNRTAYLLHLCWILPILLIQWGIARTVFQRHLRQIIIIPFLSCLYYSLSDLVAISAGIWGFDERQVTGFAVGPVPIEEILFFYLTSLLVTQSIIMFLPDSLRRRGGPS